VMVPAEGIEPPTS